MVVVVLRSSSFAPMMSLTFSYCSSMIKSYNMCVPLCVELLMDDLKVWSELLDLNILLEDPTPRSKNMFAEWQDEGQSCAYLRSVCVVGELASETYV